MIQVDYLKLENAANGILSLKNQLPTVPDSMADSLGECRNANDEILLNLYRLSDQDLPELFDATAALLRTIVADFRRAEADAASHY